MKKTKKILLNMEYDDLNKIDYYRQSRGTKTRSEYIRLIIRNYLSYQKPVADRLHYDMFGKFSDLYDKKLDSVDIQSELRKEWEK
jgi:metal-responsive CopG/Arc/MetJ family transcriptional regulator